MKKKDLTSVADLTPAEVIRLVQSGIQLKKNRTKNKFPLLAKTIALIFEKPSLRTRVTFETAMTQMGGHAIYLESGNIGPGKRESVPDIARNLERWVDGVVARTFLHATILDLAKYAQIPVINALSDQEHPCQALACMMMLQEHWGRLQDKKMVFIGDGNNVANSLMLICPKVGMDFTICCPKSFEPSRELMKIAEQEAKKFKTTIAVVREKKEAVRDASVIYTDTWASMGQEHEREKRMRIFKPFQVNEKLMKSAPSDCLVTHCLPAHRGEEITNGVMDGPQSVCFDEAENRLHIQKAILLELLA